MNTICRVRTQISSSDTIVHPRTVVVHSRNASIADSTMGRVGRFEGLALSAHGVTVFQEPLPFTGNGLNGNTTGITERCFGMTGQRHDTEHVVNHPQYDGNAFGNGQECYSNSAVRHEQPDKGGHDCTSLVTWIEPGSILCFLLLILKAWLLFLFCNRSLMGKHDNDKKQRWACAPVQL